MKSLSQELERTPYFGVNRGLKSVSGETHKVSLKGVLSAFSGLTLPSGLRDKGSTVSWTRTPGDSQIRLPALNRRDFWSGTLDVHVVPYRKRTVNRDQKETKSSRSFDHESNEKAFVVK